MTDLQWQPASGYGLCYRAVVSDMLFSTYKVKTGYYHFTVQRVVDGKPPKTIYDSRTDVFVEKTTNPGRIKEVAARWLRIKQGSAR